MSHDELGEGRTDGNASRTLCNVKQSGVPALAHLLRLSSHMTMHVHALAH